VSNAAFALPNRELVLERYRPLRPLGRGGSGSVWLSRDERTGLDVALKIVAREGKRAARAEREMEAASRLRHPRCVRAYDYGEDEGHVYIAYEYVQGRTLREVLRTDGLSDRDAVEVAAQMLEALAHAHGRGIVHRDVKPSNVLLEDGPEISTKLLDFGLAQFDEADTLTAVGDVPGTLAYISPERLSGEDASTRSDVWAVGVFLWEALSGGHPFWGVPLPEVAAAIAAGAPPLQAKRSDLPRRLLAVVDTALAIDPARRLPAGRMATELREAFMVPHRAERRAGQTTRKSPTPKQQAQPQAEPRTAIVSRERRLISSGIAGVATAGGALLLPFWPPGVVVALALAASLLTLRAPRAGLAVALFVPVFPLGNVAEGAAIAYSVVALAWLAITWRSPRTGFAFVAGVVLAPIGLLALVPLAVQPVTTAWRRGLQAFAAVLVAALAAGLTGHPLPLTGATIGDLGLAGSERPTDVLNALATVLRSESALLTTGLALGLVAAVLPLARARGLATTAALCGAQIAVILLWAPLIPPAGIVAGTLLLFALLAARPVLVAVHARRGG
jgi:predicted Ser/Thr protein kinase